LKFRNKFVSKRIGTKTLASLLAFGMALGSPMAVFADDGETAVVADRANMEAVATVVQQQLAEIGVTVNIESCDTSTFFPRFFASKDKELATTWDLGTNGWDSQRGSNCGQAISYFTNRLCDCGYSDEVSGLAQKAIGTADAKEKQELWNTIQDKALEECWEYPLTYTNFVMVSQKNVTGLDGSSVVPEFIDYLSIHVD